MEPVVDRDRRQGRDRRRDEEQRREQQRSGDAEREQVQDRRADLDRRSLDRVRDQAKILQLADRLRATEAAHPEWCHVFERHVDISDHGLAERAADWIRSAEYPDEVPHNATRWQSADAMVIAADRLARSDEFKRKLADAKANGIKRFPVNLPVQEALGPGWRADVYGRTTTSHGTQASRWNDRSFVTGVWQRQSDGRWHLLTCFPQPGE